MMIKFLLYDYGNNQLVWSSKLIVDEPSLLEDCQNGLCEYVATIFVEKKVARLSIRFNAPILRYAQAIEEKVKQHSNKIFIYYDKDQNRKLVNWLIVNGWEITRVNPDTILLHFKES
jgi:hypothetical protein